MRRKRGVLLAVMAVLLAGAGVWRLRSRRMTDVGSDRTWPEPRPAPPAPRREPPAPAPPKPAAPQALVAPPAPPAPEPAAEPEPDADPAFRPSPRPRATEAGPPGAAALPDGSPPGPEFTIKGNAGSQLFHGPTSPYYGRTKAEFWFRTPEEARAAGFTEWTPKRRRSE